MPADLLMNAIVTLIAALIGFVVVVWGWKVVHRQELERDIAAKRRELRVKYLIEAYRNLEYAANRTPTEQTRSNLERAVADIQLFGSPTQVESAQSFARDFASHGSASLDKLLSDLCRSLRQEIGLEPSEWKPVFLRVEAGAPHEPAARASESRGTE